DRLKSCGSRVKVVINTHWHFDHTDNNAPLHAAGATVVAHENTRRRMSAPQHIAILDLDFPPSPAAALPQRVFQDGYRLEAKGEHLQVSHVAPAHTDTDVIVRFERANVLHAGDVFFNRRYPLIDGSTGGRVDGMIAACDRLLHLADADTETVPRRGRPRPPPELAGLDFGPVVRRPPPLHAARIGGDDPILPHAFALIEPALCLPIGARCRWRKDLDGKEQRADVGPLSGSLPLWPYRYDEKIGLDEHVLMERDVCGRHDDFAPAPAVQVVGQMPDEPASDPLMRPSG